MSTTAEERVRFLGAVIVTSIVSLSFTLSVLLDGGLLAAAASLLPLPLWAYIAWEELGTAAPTRDRETELATDGGTRTRRPESGDDT
ncbi:hypothetical protein ACFQFH_05635 [Halobaculum halobium]|uniref:DUF3099 domain-containing protein n=1 Tax=Halobaculum halobium TaxID=3032281 RepID=A0ABD5T853_9EURY|nr:hypothetical protein [Halobaculum sp. SYNS20]